MATTPSTSRPDIRDRAQDAGTAVSRKVGETLDKAGEKAEGAASGVIQTVQDAVSGIGRQAQGMASGVADSVEDAYTATADKIGEFNDDVMRLVRRHPKQAVLIGFGAGCLVGALLFGGLFARGRR